MGKGQFGWAFQKDLQSEIRKIAVMDKPQIVRNLLGLFLWCVIYLISYYFDTLVV
jgi:hypothetical protein